ncbi:hypothetical protein N7486_004318 [Penicillium sp. IBT 16267x]|nr:hypothetical protein N7486_004318 [Penicillium sp. IBT 16267x]
MSLDCSNENLSDDISSIYSRTPETPKSFLSWSSSPAPLPPRHELPEINPLDHQIALARGSTMALETTRARLTVSKYHKKLSLAELKEEKISQRDQQEEENQFYRSCFENFRQLATTAIEASAVETTQDLSLQSHFEPERGNANLKLAVDRLRVALENSRVQEAQAEREWKRKWEASRFWNPAPRWI